MIRIQHAYERENVVFSATGSASGAIGRLFGAASEIEDIDHWGTGDAARCDALGALRMYGEHNPETVRFEEGRIVAAHSAVAALGKGQATALGLPGRPPFVLATDTSGTIGSPDFKLTARWLDNGQPVATRRQGAFLETAKGTFLIPQPLFSAVELADEFDAGAVDLPDHWTALARFRRLFDAGSNEAGNPVEMSRFLRGLRIYTGTAMSLSLVGDGDDVDFDPVLFDPDAVSGAASEGRPPAESDGMLRESDLRTFQKDSRTGFRAFDAAKRSYLLGPKTYLIVDDDLETALQVVREKQRAAPAERRAFAANPRAAIAERLTVKAGTQDAEADTETADSTDEDIEARAAALFVETPEYADRAVGIGLWQVPRFDFLPHVPNVWLPEIFALELGGNWVRLDRNTVEGLRRKVDQALEKGESTVDHEGQPIPATPDVRKKLAEIVGIEAPAPPSGSDSDEAGDGGAERPATVIIVRQNFVEENWSPQGSPREAFIENRPPRSLRSTLFDHQRAAFDWQIDAWRAGHPGILNADDQGLGKTIQTLAFLAWLQEQMAAGPPETRRPLLIVAPTGLLRTWEGEEKEHLTGTRLGARIDAYRTALRKLRIPGLDGKDTDDGKPRLAFDDVRSAIEHGNGHKCWLLTTYETMASYQHSFRRIDFAVVVFDEIQKIKNVKTLMASAARALRADFRIGLTGTPIENHVADLWAIMDAIAPGSPERPGRLGTLAAYLERYRTVTEAGMKELHSRLFTPTKAGERYWPPLAQRRLKETEIAGLPRKDYQLYPVTMPSAQAEAYEGARRHLADGARGAALKLLHHIRGVSLHSEPPDAVQGDIDAYLGRAARFDAIRRVLTRVRDRGERALVFTEDRRIQGFVAQWLRSEFALDKVRIVNGETAIAKRKQYVTEFQRHLKTDRGFDVMVLSPRAAGIGLTLTAATHVIHLSRWWNPAVEEQCNDRIYRIGQTRDVTVHVPLAVHPVYREGSFDCVLNDLMRRKRALARAALWPPVESDFDNGMLVTGVSGAEALDPGTLDDLDWKAFENWIVDRALKSGDWEVSETPWSGDGGADAILRHRYRRDTAALIQAKHTTDRDRSVRSRAIREILAAKERYTIRGVQPVVITNARAFTEDARHLALKHEVRLVDRDRLGLWPNHVLG